MIGRHVTSDVKHCCGDGLTACEALRVQQIRCFPNLIKSGRFRVLAQKAMVEAYIGSEFEWATTSRVVGHDLNDVQRPNQYSHPYCTVDGRTPGPPGWMN